MPANGWNPTDIHVRTYSDKQSFSRAVAYTHDARRRTPTDARDRVPSALLGADAQLHRVSRLLAAEPFSNDGPVAEYWACRERAAIMDLSPLRKFEVTGPDAEALLQYALTRNVRKLAVGQVVYTAMCYEHGGMIDDGTLFRLGDNNFRWIGGDDYGGIWLRELAEKLGLKAWVRSSTDQLHNVAVQGPKSRDILREVDLDAAGAAHRRTSSAGSASPSAASAASTARRSSCRAPAIPASSATRSSAIPRTRSPCSTRSGRPASRTG